MINLGRFPPRDRVDVPKRFGVLLILIGVGCLKTLTGLRTGVRSASGERNGDRSERKAGVVGSVSPSMDKTLARDEREGVEESLDFSLPSASTAAAGTPMPDEVSRASSS